ncbi:MAG: response regulator [Myxococcales bacterium]
MPRVVDALMFLSGGFATAGGVAFLLALRRRTERTLLAFAGMALCGSLFAGVCAAIARTSDLSTMRQLAHAAGVSVTWASACSVLFFGCLLYGRPPGRYRLSAFACLALSVAALVSPGALRHTHLVGVALRLTPWGERVHEELGPANWRGIALLHFVTASVSAMPLYDALRNRSQVENRLPVICTCTLWLGFWLWDVVVGMTGWSRGIGLVLIAYPSTIALLALWLAGRERLLADRLARIEAQQQHAEKLQALGQLAGGIAHDFNNLLSGVLGAAELLGRSLDRESSAARLLAIVQDAGQRAKELTSQLLSYSRRGRKSSEPINLHELVSATLVLAERTFDPRIRIACALHAARPVVVGDHAQLHAALLNLCINARDAMPEGGELRVTSADLRFEEHSAEAVARGLKPGDYLCVRISDTGIGMSAEIQRHLFEPFFTTKPVGHGTGLGLASTYGALAEHHGAISVESLEGQGTTFEILLPRASQQAPEAVSDDTTVTRPRERKRVLIVDDQQMIREVSGALLRQLGYEVDTMSHARDVLAHFRGGGDPYACVVLDMAMPDMNGRQCFEALHAIEPDVPVVLCSGLMAETTLAELREEGLAGFVTKPFSGAEIARAIERASSMNRPRAPDIEPS